MDGIGDARLFYLLALLALVAGGVFATYRGRLATGLQHALIWGLIFAGVVIAYGFRDVLSAQLFNTPTAVGDSAVVLRRGGDGHFHATLGVNGRDVSFLVDTGATQIVLSRRDAARVGFDPARLSFTQPARTANGTVFSAPVTLDRLTLGPFEDRGVPASVNGGELPVSLLGIRYLDRFARWRVEGDRMFLER